MYSTCNLKHSFPKKIAIVLHNGSNDDYHFIIKELAEEFKKQFTSLGGSTENYITLTVPIEKWRGDYKKYILHITIYW